MVPPSSALPQGSPQAGSILGGRYEVVRPLGSGGMGTVVLARDVHHTPGVGGPSERWVAIKAAGGAGTRAYLKKEAAMLERLHHPNLPAVEATVEEDGRLFVVMEYVPGTSLDARVREHGAFPVEQVADWMSVVLDVLRYLHRPSGVGDPRPERDVAPPSDPNATRRRGDAEAESSTATPRQPYVHCDIKPANLVLADEGGLFVVDLGIARSHDPALSVVAPSSAGQGTVGFAAPELVLGPASGATAVPQSDLYSVGMTALVLAVGPAADPTELSAVKRSRGRSSAGGDPLDRVLDGSDLPVWFREWIRTATALEVEARFANAEEMLRALQSGRYGGGLEARRAWRKPVWAGAALISAVLVTMAVLWLPETGGGETAVEQSEPQSPDPLLAQAADTVTADTLTAVTPTELDRLEPRPPAPLDERLGAGEDAPGTPDRQPPPETPPASRVEAPAQTSPAPAPPTASVVRVAVSTNQSGVPLMLDGASSRGAAEFTVGTQRRIDAPEGWDLASVTVYENGRARVISAPPDGGVVLDVRPGIERVEVEVVEDASELDFSIQAPAPK